MPTPKLWGYVLLGAAAVVAALTGGRPEPLVLAAPMLVVLAAGLRSPGPTGLAVQAAVEPARITFGDACELTLTVQGPVGSLVDVRLDLPAAVSVPAGVRHRLLVSDEGSATLSLPIELRRWGAFDLGGLTCRVVAPGGLLAADERLHAPVALRAYPPPRMLRELVEAHETSLVVGTHVARGKGAGLEFAELRAHRPGDRVREVNWRATARRGSVWVNERHPERSIDVVVLVDAFSAHELPRAVAAADALVRAHLGGRDRVGLVSFGGATRWVRPGMGGRQLYTVVDALLESRVVATEIWRDLTVVPARVLPPKGVIIAVSPLQDDRTLAALRDLRDRGRDVAVLALASPRLEQTPPDAESALAERLRRLHWDALLDDLHHRGIPAEAVDDDAALGEAVESLSLQHRRLAWHR